MKPIDLTLTISEQLPSFPGSPNPIFISWAKLKPDGYNLELLFLSSHTGTHIDAPYHFYEKGQKINQIPLNRLISRAVLIRCKKGPNQNISQKNIIDFEEKFGKIPRNSCVIFFTDWQSSLEKKEYFSKNPGLSSEAAKYLISRKVNLVGIDSPSIDVGNNKKFSVHKILLKKNILIVENLANLNKIPTNYFNLIVLPLKLQNATGSSVRAIAI